MARVTYVIRHDERPWTANSERRMHHMQRHALVKAWRTAFFALALENHLPKGMTNVEIIVTPYVATRRSLPDVAGNFPSAKASIDGLVDAQVMEDDNPDFLKFLGFRAPVVGQGDALELEITGDIDGTSPPSRAKNRPRKRPHNGYKAKASSP